MLTRRISLGLYAVLAILSGLASGCRHEAANLPAPTAKLVSDDPWKLTIKSPEPARAYLGNGYIGITASQEGWGSDGAEKLPCYLSGYYTKDEKIARAPEWHALDLKVDGKRLSPQGSADYEQTLDLRRGLLQTRYTWRGGPNVQVEITLFPARQEANLGVMQVVLTPDRDCQLAVDRGPGMVTPAGRLEMCRLDDQVSVGNSRPAALAVPQVALRANERWTLTRFAAVNAETGGSGIDLLKVTLDHAHDQGYDEILRRHTAAWEALWKRDIAIEGDAKLQQVVNSFRYQLLASVREGRADSVPPMGLSSDIYLGHIFWDADTWVFPALVPQYPELARSIVEYRYRTLPAAKENARKQGLPGADYAWESAATGHETVQGEFALGRHVNADIALAQWQYYLWTGDRQWLKTTGYPVIRATADNWLGRAKLNQAQGRYEVARVMGPDETRGPVDNNAWTNAMAQLNLELASRAAKVVGERPDPRWKKVAKGLWIPFDKAAGRYLQYGGYTPEDHKQADCELLLYPRRLEMPADVAAKTYDYYKGRVSHLGPAMTSSIYAIIAARLGRREEAAERFKDSWEPFVRPPYLLFNEKRTSSMPRTDFVTGLSGTLQSLLYGFAGLEPTESGLRTKATLPPGWKRLRVKGVRWRGQVKDLDLAGGS